MNDTNDQNTAIRYCTCYVKRQVNRTIHVCRKCGKQIYQQPKLTSRQIVVILALLATVDYFLSVWLQANGATP